MEGKLYYRWESELTPEEICARIRALGLPKDPDWDLNRHSRPFAHPTFWYELFPLSNETDFRLYISNEGRFEPGGRYHQECFSGTICETEGKTVIKGAFRVPLQVLTVVLGLVALFCLIGTFDGGLPAETLGAVVLLFLLACGVQLLGWQTDEEWMQEVLDLIENNLLKR